VTSVLSVLLWILGGVVGLIVLYLLVMFLVTMVTLAMGNAPPGIAVTVTSEPRCCLGEDLEVTVVVRNTLERQRRITSVYIDATYLDGFVVGAIAPEPVTRSDGPVLRQQIYSMDVPLAPDSSETVTLTLRAVKRGEFQGDLTVYVDGGHFRYIAKPLRAHVYPAPSAEGSRSTGSGDETIAQVES
jgi:uncharacterized protein (DUF58 family)